jgi:predicted MFS family arabinose efflux permease
VTDGTAARHPTVGLGVLSFATFVAVTSELLPIGVLPQISSGLGVSTSIAGLTVSLFAALVAITAIPMTSLTERAPRKLLLVIAISGYVVSNLVAAIAPDFAVLCVARAIGGLSHAIFYSVVTAYAPALVPPHRVGRALSITFAGASLGSVLGVPVTSLIGIQAGWRVAFVTMAIAAAILLVVVVLVLPPVAGTPRRAASPVRFRPGLGLAVVVAADVLVFWGHNTVYTYVGPLLGLAGIRDAGLSAALLILGAVSIGGLIASGLLADRHLRGVFAASALLVAITLGLFVLWESSPVPAVADAAIWCLAFGAVSPLVTTATLRTGAVSSSMAGAVANSASNVGITLGSLLGGGVIALGALPALPAVGAVFALAAGLVIAFSPRAFRTPIVGPDRP